MRDHRTPAQLRADRRVEAAHVLDEALRAEGSQATAVAALLGVPRQRVDEWRDVHEDRHLTVADAAGMPPAVRRHLAEYVAGPGYQVAELPDEHHDLRFDLSLAARLVRESGETAAVLLEALADGHVCRAEGARLAREADEAIRVLLFVRELGRRAAREGIVGAQPPLRAVEGGGR